ncbi:DUF6686 family protein [Dyadobacter sp. CY356]|uniref:DUF6686 family protein n=1 Tax=Dyadobacter sp. CY356 TaxID=2906442 RepID=UPI001F40D2F9|nr:DUF6686 family protein [Dyadobacter sp. CY356]MCF0057858.1 hypothetical protein [Dyadobacter sp. CY356]
MHDASHSHSSLRILSQSKNGYIGQCSCCDHYNFVFGNVLFIFSEDGLSGFHAMLYDKHQFQSLDTALPHGRNHLLRSPIPNFMLSFNDDEVEEIKNLLQETLLALEIDRIFSNHK